MSWFPHRTASYGAGPTAPPGGSEAMAPPPWNRGGIDPGQLTPRGMDNWSTRVDQSWVLDGTTWRWTIQAPVFDTRPGLTPANGMPNAGTPINHEAAIGLNIFFLVAIFSKSGLNPPAVQPGIRCRYWEDGNPVAATPMIRFTRQIDITSVLLSGGNTAGTNSGSLIQIEPVQPSLRFWQPTVQIFIEDSGALSPPATDFVAIAAIH